MTKDTVITYTAGGNSLLFCARPDSVLWLTDATGISSNDITISETQAVGQVGTTVHNQAVQPREITLSGAVLADVEQNRRGILSCIRPGVAGRLTVRQGGESWYIDCMPKRTPEFSNGSRLQSFQVVLHCPYPYFYSTQSGATQLAGLAPLFSFPCNLAGTWYLSKYTDSMFATVNNAGAVALGFDVILTALTQVTNPEIYHVEQRTRLRIIKVMEAGERITISTVYGRKGVTMALANGTEENGFQYLDVESDLNMQIVPGTNTIRCDADDNRDGLQVQIVLPREGVPGL